MSTVLSAVGERVVGLHQATRWARQLSHQSLTFTDGGAAAAWAERLAVHRVGLAALAPVGRGDGGFAMAALVEAFPKLESHISFGLGRAMATHGKTTFGFNAAGTCGLTQDANQELTRGATATKDFGLRADTLIPGTQLNFARVPGFDPPIRAGSRLALHLSPRGVDGRRTARFLVDRQQVAVFSEIEDDGGSSDWVAGFALTPGARVRIVPVEAEEAQPSGWPAGTLFQR